MIRCSGFVLAVALTACAGTSARGDHFITWGDNQPAATQANGISASGNYRAEAGWQVAIVWLQAVPSSGGVVSKTACRVDTNKQTWSGRVAPLKPGDYQVYLFMKLVNRETLERVSYGSSVKSVTVLADQ
jgi:hypothetical protein